MSFVINVTDQQAATIQTYMTALGIEGTPQENIQGYVDGMLNFDVDQYNKNQVIAQIQAILPTYDSTDKDLATLQADLATIQGMEAQ